MAQKKSKKKKQSSGSVKRAVILTFGSAAAIGAFFFAGYAVDYFTAKTGRPPASQSRFFNTPEKRTADTGKLRKNKALRFFSDLVLKKRQQHQHDGAGSAAPAKRQDPQRVTPPVADRASETSGTKTKEKPDVVPEHVSYTIQLGAFLESERARSFCENLAEKGYEPYIMEVNTPTRGTMYRVRVGAFRRIEEAQITAKQIEKNEKITVMITSR